MKFVVRLFFRILRRILGPIILLLDWLTSPKGIQRPTDEQQKIDQDTRGMTLYQFRSCPFCIRVRRHTKRLSLNIETRDALRNPTNRLQLLTGGGQIKVPCLKVTNEAGEDQWMYESSEIIHFLDSRFGRFTSPVEQHATRH